MPDTTSLGFPIWDPTGSDSNENVYALLLSLIGTQASSAMRLNETYIQDLKNTKLTIYSKTAAAWLSDTTTIMKSGEFGIETDTGKVKFGNGTDNWSVLPYFSSSEVLSGSEDPTTSVTGKMGQVYINTVYPSIWQCINESTNAWVTIYPQSIEGGGNGFTPVLTLEDNGDLYVEYQDTEDPPEDAILGNIVGPPGKSGVFYGPVEDAPEDATVIVDPDGDVFNTDNVPEGETNLYFTNERVDDRLAQYKIGTTPDLPLFTGEDGAVDTKTAAQALMALGAAKAPVTHTVTLLASNWNPAGSGYSQIVDVVGMRSTLNILVSPSPDDFYDYVAANVYCYIQSYDSLAFLAMSLPDEDLAVNVLIVG